MKITELTAGQTITILVITGDEQFEFECSIENVNPKKHMIYTTPIMKNGKVLSFKGPLIQTHILVQLPDLLPIIYRNAIISPMRKKDGICYGIVATGEGLTYNRRHSFRCFVELHSVLKLSSSHVTYDIILRDVSMTGFSFVFLSSEDKCEMGQLAHIVLNDYIQELFENYNFHLYGIVCRINELENGKVIYGCRLTDRIRGLDQYIAKKERIRIQNQRGKL